MTEYKSINIQDENLIKRKQKLKNQKKQIENEIQKIVAKPENIVPFLVPGRLIHVKTNKDDWGWGVLVSFSKQRITAKNKDIFKSKQNNLDEIIDPTQPNYILDVYLYSKNKLTSDAYLQPGDPKQGDGRLGIVPVILHHSTIKAISTIQLNLPHNHRDADNSKTVEIMYMELLRRFENGKNLKILHPIDDM